MSAEVAGKAGEEREAAEAEAAAREELRAAEAAASAAAATVADAARDVTAAEDAHRATLMERRALEAEADHLRAALLDMEDVGGEVMEVAGEFPGTVSLAGSVSCEPGYERALAAALAQLSGALAVPAGVDQWSLLDALKRAGVGLVRLVVPARRRPSTAFPGAAPLADKVSFGDHEGLEGALADVVIVDDLRAVPAEFTGLAVTRAGEYYRPADGQIGLAGGVPAALLLERRASLERLGEKLAAVSAREAREEAAAAAGRGPPDRGARGGGRGGGGRARGAHRGGDGGARAGPGALPPPRPRGAPAARPARRGGHRRRAGRGGLRQGGRGRGGGERAAAGRAAAAGRGRGRGGAAPVRGRALGAHSPS